MSAKNPYKFVSPKIMSDDTAKKSFKDFKFSMDDIKGSFDSIQKKGNYMAARVNQMIPSDEYNPYVLKALKKFSNHFQGIKRLYKSKYFVISGGHSETKQALLVIAKMGSRPTKNALRSNIVGPDIPDENTNIDKITTVLQVNESPDQVKLSINNKFWHTGGIGLYSDILAVPIEGEKDLKGSQILFYSVKNPEKPKLFNFTIKREKTKAGCVALTRLPSGLYLLAVLCAPKSGQLQLPYRKKKYRVKIKYKQVDFYLSKTINFHQGFRNVPFSWTTKKLYLDGKLVPTFSSFQCIDLLVEEKADKSSLYLLGFDNTSPAAPIVGGKDYADLYKIGIKSKHLKDTQLKSFNFETIRKVAFKELNESDKQSNFDAGAGVYIQSPKSFFVYGCYHWKVDLCLRFIEYHADPEEFTGKLLTGPRDSWIELYEHKDFKGRRLGLVGVNSRYTTIEDYGLIKVQGSHFDKKVSSVRYQIAGEHNYELFEDPHFGKYSEEKIKKLPLEADGKVHSIKNLKKFKVQSSKYENA